MALKTKRWDVTEFLDSAESIAEYLEAVFEDGDPSLIAAALGDVARAIGMSQLASQAGVTREALYKALSLQGDPRLSTFLGVMKALGIKLTPRASCAHAAIVTSADSHSSLNTRKSMGGKFHLKKSSDGQFRFVLKAGKGETILTSEAYRAKASATSGIDSVKKNALLDERYERKVDKTGHPRFNLKAANHEIIGRSEVYKSEAARDNGIESVKKKAPEAVIVDET